MTRNIKDIIWLAGLLEGEGSFGWYTVDHSNGKRYSRASIQLEMCDLDIISRVRDILYEDDYKKGISNLYQRTNRTSYDTEYKLDKPSYKIAAFSNRAIQWMMTLYPLMGIRRKEKIKEVIIAWKIYSPRELNSTFPKRRLSAKL